MNSFKKLLSILIIPALLLGCEPQNDVDSNSGGYVEEGLQGIWQSLDYSYSNHQIPTFTINGSEIIWCGPATHEKEADYGPFGTIEKDSITYTIGNEEISSAYKLEGDTLKIVPPYSNQEYIFIKDSDFNPCDGNINNSSFQFKIIYDDRVYTSPSGEEVYGSPSADYELRVNGVTLFDETRTMDEGRSCSYTITPNINYDIDIYFRFRYCNGHECANTNNWTYKTIRKTIKLTKLQNTVCNILKIDHTSQSEVVFKEWTHNELAGYKFNR
jgi:hypothetical protein